MRVFVRDRCKFSDCSGMNLRGDPGLLPVFRILLGNGSPATAGSRVADGGCAFKALRLRFPIAHKGTSRAPW